MPQALANLTTCTACGCTCDDIRLTIGADGEVADIGPTCALGEEWFRQPLAVGPVAGIAGAPVTLDEAIGRSAEILQHARHPLVAGLSAATTEAIRAATALADRVGAVIDWTTSAADAASTLALQTVGGVTATLGEIAQRSDVVVLWAADLRASHPRHFERYSLKPTSRWLPSGRADRTLVVVGDAANTSMSEADETFTIAAGRHFEALTTLRAVLADVSLDETDIRNQTGVELARWQALAGRMQSAKYGAVIYGKPLAASGPESLGELTQLMAALTAHTRFVAVAAGGAGNAAGAASVLTWQTGCPLGVSLAKGYPEYGPGEWNTEKMLARGEVDAALIVADDLTALLSGEAAGQLARLPTIALDWRDTATTDGAEVAIRVARPGVECGGTTYRTDGVALPLRGCKQSDRPTAESVLNQIAQRLT